MKKYLLLLMAIILFPIAASTTSINGIFQGDGRDITQLGEYYVNIISQLIAQRIFKGKVSKGATSFGGQVKCLPMDRSKRYDARIVGLLHKEIKNKKARNVVLNSAIVLKINNLDNYFVACEPVSWAIWNPPKKIPYGVILRDSQSLEKKNVSLERFSEDLAKDYNKIFTDIQNNWHAIDAVPLANEDHRRWRLLMRRKGEAPYLYYIKELIHCLAERWGLDEHVYYYSEGDGLEVVNKKHPHAASTFMIGPFLKIDEELFDVVHNVFKFNITGQQIKQIVEIKEQKK
jgi:hypothetical protein